MLDMPHLLVWTITLMVASKWLSSAVAWYSYAPLKEKREKNAGSNG